MLLREVGRRATYVPVWETLVCGVLPLARAGTEAQQRRLLPGVSTGETRLAAALQEPGAGLAAGPWRPTTEMRSDGDRWVLTGTKIGVLSADVARALLVPAAVTDTGDVGRGPGRPEGRPA